MQTGNPQLIDFEPIILNFFSRNDIAGPLDYLKHCIPAGARIFVAGGAIRNLLIKTIHGAAPETRDIDLFIGDLHPNVFFGTASDRYAG